jgi:hypothetical protein
MAFISTNTTYYLADTRTQSKVVYLPAASTAQGRMITIKDYFGTTSLSTLTISTLGLDRIDIQSNAILMNQDFESIDFIGAGNTNWSVLGNYMGALTQRIRSTTLFGISNLNLWLDGSDSTTMTFANDNTLDVLTWKDKSSNAYTFLPVNSNVRSRFSTNCITINQSTSHFVSQVDIPGSQQEDLFCVINEDSMRGPLMGLLENADLMWFETDGRYHSQFFADGNTTFTTVGGGANFSRFFIFQGNFYYISDGLNPTPLNLYSNAAFVQVSSMVGVANARGATVFDGRAYIPHGNGIMSVLPNGVISTILVPASNFANACLYNNEIYANSFTSNYPTYKFNPATGVSTLLTFSGQSGARLFQYNGLLYSMNDGAGNFIQVLNNPFTRTPWWGSVFNQNYTISFSYIVFSNSIMYGQNTAPRLIEWRQDTGCLYVASNSNVGYAGTRTPIVNYRGRIIVGAGRYDNNANIQNTINVFTGKNKGVSGGNDIVQLTNQTYWGHGAMGVYDGSLFVGSECNGIIIRYGNGATVDTNVSSITGGPRVVLLRKNGTTNSMWVNGVELSNKSVAFTYSNNLAQPWYVGGVTGSILQIYSDPGTDHMTGGLYEIMNFTSTLVTADRQKVEGYLAWKYGVASNLPVSHPYKSSPPTS